MKECKCKCNTNVPEPPKPPCSRIIKEGAIGICPKCGSSVKRSFFGLGRVLGCIQPECENYWEKMKLVK